MHPRIPFLLLLGALVLDGGASAQSLASTSGQVLLAEGDPIPGIPGAQNGGPGALDPAVIDRAGNVLFRARFTGAVTSELDDRAYLVGHGSGDLHVLVRAGDPDPSGTWPGARLVQTLAPGSFFGGLGATPWASPENGLFLFTAHLSGGGIVSSGTTLAGRNDSVLYVGSPGSWRILAQEGDPAPVGGALFDQLDFPSLGHRASALGSTGVACFVASLVGGDVGSTAVNNASVLLAGTPGALQVVQRSGDTVLGGQVIGAIGIDHQLNGRGQVLHSETLDLLAGSPPATIGDQACLFLWTPSGGNALLARQGDPAPGTGGAHYGVPGMARGFGAAGQAAFVATLAGVGVTPGVDDQAIFLGTPGGVRLLVRKGDEAPGLPTGTVLNVVDARCAYADQDGGTVAFFASVTGPGVTLFSDSSVWIASASQRRVLCREGDPAPGWSDVPNLESAVFGQIEPGACVIDARGQVVIEGVTVRVRTRDPGTGSSVLTVYSSNHYLWDPTLGLRLLFRNGDPLATSAGGRVSSSALLVPFSSGDGGMLALDDDGDVVLGASFALGGAIVRAHVGSIDCLPSSLSTLAGGVHRMLLDAGPAGAGRPYVVLVSGSGTRPGFTLGVHVPLNPDSWTQLGLASLNAAPWAGNLGVLDGAGRATATLTLPPGTGAFAGIELDHALVVLDAHLRPFLGSEPCAVELF